MDEDQAEDEARPAARVAGLYRRQEGHTAVEDGATRHRAELISGEDGEKDWKQASNKDFG